MSGKSSTTSTKNDGTTKTLVRNCRSVPAVVKSDNRKDQAPETKVTTVRRKTASEVLNLAEPQLHSTLKLKENLDKMKAGMKTVRFEQKVQSKTLPKAAAKVNIKFDEQIYRNLIDLKVSDDDLGLRPISTAKPKEFSRVRDAVPVLSDYYKPTFDKEYVVKPYTPVWPLHNQQSTRRHKESTVLRAVKRWSVDDKAIV